MGVPRKTVVDMLPDPVMDLSALPRRIHMHVDASEMLDVMKKLVSHFTSNTVSVGDR